MSTLSDPKVTLWYTRCSVPTAFGLAVRNGLIEKEFEDDVDVAFVPLQTSPDPKVHQSHYTHTQPNSFRHGGNSPAIWAQANGADTKIIGISWIEFPQTILALPDSGIKSVKDLKGKRLLILKRANEPIDFWYALSLRIYEKALATAGLTLKDVNLVEHIVDRSFINDHRGASESQNAAVPRSRRGQGWYLDSLSPLLREEVDVIPTQFGHVQSLLGGDVIFDLAWLPNRLDRVNNDYPYVFAVNAGLIEERPDLVARIYARVLEAIEWSKRYPADTIRAIAQEQVTSEAVAKKTFGAALKGGLDLDLDPEGVQALQLQKDFLLKHGLIKKDFDVEKWVDPRPLAAARRLLAERTVPNI